MQFIDKLFFKLKKNINCLERPGNKNCLFKDNRAFFKEFLFIAIKLNFFIIINKVNLNLNSFLDICIKQPTFSLKLTNHL